MKNRRGRKVQLLLLVLLCIFLLHGVLCSTPHVLAFSISSSKTVPNLACTITGSRRRDHRNVRNRNYRVVPLPFSEELGVSNSILFQNKFFDPLHLATEESFVRYREAELKHGRVAMLATAGMIFPDLVPSDSKQPLTSFNQILSLFDQPNLTVWPSSGVQAILVVPLGVWVSMTVGIAILELFVLKQRSSKALPGDYSTGFFGVHDYGKHEKQLQQELEYGRLAMIGFVLQILWEVITNTSVVEPYRMLINYISDAFT
jgi:hypothetical protein